jgi:hypothetical protein
VKSSAGLFLLVSLCSILGVQRRHCEVGEALFHPPMTSALEDAGELLLTICRGAWPRRGLACAFCQTSRDAAFEGFTVRERVEARRPFS